MRSVPDIQKALMRIVDSKRDDHSETYQVEAMLLIVIEALLDIRDILKGK